MSKSCSFGSFLLRKKHTHYDLSFLHPVAPTAPVRKIATASKRKQKIPEPVMVVEEEEEEDEEEEEEEDEDDESITRCVCGESRKLTICDTCKFIS